MKGCREGIRCKVAELGSFPIGRVSCGGCSLREPLPLSFIMHHAFFVGWFIISYRLHPLNCIGCCTRALHDAIEALGLTTYTEECLLAFSMIATGKLQKAHLAKEVVSLVVSCWKSLHHKESSCNLHSRRIELSIRCYRHLSARQKEHCNDLVNQLADYIDLKFVAKASLPPSSLLCKQFMFGLWRVTLR